MDTTIIPKAMNSGISPTFSAKEKAFTLGDLDRLSSSFSTKKTSSVIMATRAKEEPRFIRATLDTLDVDVIDDTIVETVMVVTVEIIWQPFIELIPRHSIG